MSQSASRFAARSMSRLRACLPLIPPSSALALLLLACGGGGSTPGGTGPGEAPFGLEVRPVLTPLAFPDTQPPPTSVELERAFSNLTFARPVFLTAAPDGSSWVYVVEQDGRILVFENDDTVTSASTFLDLRGLVSRAGNEEGLLGLAFDPAWGRGGPGSTSFWVYYSASGPRRSVVARYEATLPTSGPPAAVSSSETVVLEVAQPSGNHNAGMLAFGPDDMLYVALGDGGGANDPGNHGQDLSTLLGSILRLDVRGRSTYVVPSGNPFVGMPGARGEIWAYGLRNPWRFSFDRDTGDLWVADVGQGAREEVDRILKGGNYGWPIYEGERTNRNPDALPPGDFERPVVDYPRTLGTSTTGGYVYRGQDVPSLRGAYVYGDYGSGRVWALVQSGGSVVSNEQVATVTSIASFGEDHRGELYAVSLGGAIHRVREPAGGTPPGVFPEKLSETGLFTDTATLTPNPGLIEYEVNAQLFSDDSGKRRWLALPQGGRIGFTATGAWTFPAGTVLVKHFELELRVGDPSSARRVETRALVLETEGWRGYSWRWNDQQTDADLLPGALSEVFSIDDPAAPGGAREQRWEYPSRADCLRCHTPAAGYVLGVRTLQLNREREFPLATDNQLRTFDHIGLFDRDLGSPGDFLAMADPYDASQPVSTRARSYLDANCAFCHQPGGPAPGDMDLRFLTPDAATHLIDERPTEGDVGIADAWRVRPGAKEQSVLWERVRRRGDHQMPPLATTEIDEDAVDVIGAWIDGL